VIETLLQYWAAIKLSAKVTMQELFGLFHDEDD
jgi:hypothetical protein